MDISSLIADSVGPRSVKLEAPREQKLAIDALVPLAQHRLRVFDHDLTDTGWEGAAREAALSAFLLASRTNRLDILLRDTRYLEKHCARLRNLQRRFSHLVSVHLCGENAMHATDPLFVVDEQHFVHRFHYQQPDAAAGLFLPVQTRALILQFDALWADSAPTLPPTTLGL